MSDTDTNVLQNDCETPSDLSQSFCDDGATKCGDARVRFNCPSGVCPLPCDSSDDDCPGGVCPLPKRKMCSPEEAEAKSAAAGGAGGGDPLQILGMDKLFSNMLTSIFSQNPGDKSQNPLLDQLFKRPSSPQNSKDEDDYSEDEGDEGDEGDAHSECSHSECNHTHDHTHDHRWSIIEKLVESHLNLTRAVEALVNPSRD